MNYGLPYMGSKSKIANEIVNIFPVADNFYDLFAGGCAITHALMVKDYGLHGKAFKRYFANDISGSPQLFLDAINGKYKNEKRWISREYFHANKDTDPYIKWIWSFSDNGCSYQFSKDIEPIKKAFHYVVMFNEWCCFNQLYDYEYLSVVLTNYGVDDKKMFLDLYSSQYKKGLGRIEHLRVIKWIQKNYINQRYPFAELQHLERLQRLEQLQHLERLERLQRLPQQEGLQRLETLTITQLDYRDVEILSNSIVYCDIPYNTGHLNYVKFDHLSFWNWAEKQTFPIYVSEYSYSGNNPELWDIVYSKDKLNLRVKSYGKRTTSKELVYWNRKCALTT